MDTKSISFENYRISLESVMKQFPGEGSEMYEDIVDELLEDAASLAAPRAYWRPLAVRVLSDQEVQLANTVISSPYLVDRLREVDQVYAFICSIGESLWNNRNSMTDALEEFLYDAVMKTCLDEAFARMAAVIAAKLPDKTELYMDNPGSQAGWGLSGQQMLLDLLEVEAVSDTIKDWKINAGYVFDNSFTISGLIYGKNAQSADCVLCPKESCSHRRASYDQQRLTERLYKTSIGMV